GEALPGALGRRIEAALEVEDGRAALGRQLGRVPVRPLDRRRDAARRHVTEAAAVPPGGDVADGVELLARLAERLLEGELVAGRDEQRMARAPFPEERRKSGEGPVQRSRLAVGLD